ncbi:MAG: hypothetical protein N4A49_03880 [Marinifilaceae bacterium]|jgi:carbamoyltransferase|nr:hypothetical protein [Marinifilaceae bacterium]
MKKSKATLAIYGIRDNNNSPYPIISHDHSIAIFKEKKLVRFAQLERLTRQKRDNKLDKHLYRILKEEKMLGEEYDLVFVDNILGRSFISEEGNIRFEANINTSLNNGLEKGRASFLNENCDAYILNHELAHIASCLPFYGKFKDNSLLVHYDGGASLSNFSVWTYNKGEIQNLEFTWDFKYISSFFNANALNFAIVESKIFDQNAVPGKFMGFASFGEYKPEIENWLKENDYFSDIWKSKKKFYDNAAADFGYKKRYIDQKDKFIQDIAACFQEIFTRELLLKLKHLQKSTNTEYLYYSGGSALNIVANNKIIESNIFKDVFIPPCSEDSGLAIGAAAFMELCKHDGIEVHSPYLNNWSISNYELDYDDKDIKEIAEFLLNDNIIGVCNSYGEIGPRALGNRSLLALANSKELSRKLSCDMKQREWYRPIAPIMLKSNLEYFTGSSDSSMLSKFMLRDYFVLAEKQEEIEGVVHINGSARIQTVDSRDDNPFIFDLLTYLDENCNIKALINTSFNTKGEPIVHTIDDAINSAGNLGLDGLVCNGKLRTDF